MKTTDDLPLVSIIIPTYNYARFLAKAIQSSLDQTYPNVEIIVIDDGSTDSTTNLVKNFPQVKYYYQENKGLSAARNCGIEKANGKYLVFLDADDWLDKDALFNNYSVIKDKPQLAFVSGNYYLLRAATNKLTAVSVTVPGNHYTRLLQANYIGMHAAVMFQRWIFNQFKYDEQLAACEDYDLYLRITRMHPVLHHDKFIATYYFHSNGMSHNYETMMQSVKRVMEKQAGNISSEEERTAYAQGLHQWNEYYELLEESQLL